MASGTIKAVASKADIDSLNSKITNKLDTLQNYSATSATDFLSQLLDYVLSQGGGSRVFGATWTSHYFCLVNASAQSSTRCVIQVVPQPANLNYIFIAEANNGTKTYKQIAMSSIT